MPGRWCFFLSLWCGLIAQPNTWRLGQLLLVSFVHSGIRSLIFAVFRSWMTVNPCALHPTELITVRQLILYLVPRNSDQYSTLKQAISHKRSSVPFASSSITHEENLMHAVTNIRKRWILVQHLAWVPPATRHMPWRVCRRTLVAVSLTHDLLLLDQVRMKAPFWSGDRLTRLIVISPLHKHPYNVWLT